MRRIILAVTLLLTGGGERLLNGQDFWNRSHGPSPGRVTALTVARNGHLLAGRQGEMGIGGSVLRSSDNGGSWERMNNGLLDTNVVSLLVTRGGTILAGMSAWFGQPGVCLYRSTNEGTSWSRSDGGLAGAGVVLSLAEDSTGSLFCGAEFGMSGSVRALFHSTDDGISWVPTPTQLPPNAPVNALLVNREGVLFAAAYSSIYRSSDRGITWDTVASGLFSSLAVGSDGTLFAGIGYAGGMSRSADKGDTWVRTSFDSGAVHALAVTPENVLFAGTQEKGVFWSSDQGDSWHRNNTGLPTLWVWSLLFAQNGYLFAGTSNGSIYRTTGPVTMVGDQAPAIPQEYVLCQNFPNPFNPSTTIRYGLPVRSQVTLALFNILGQQVAEILRREEEAGYHEVRFDGSGLASGVYLYRLQAGRFIQTRRFLLVR